MQKGEKLGRYKIRQKIGEGGMGEVYLAYDEQLDRDVVLKILLPKFLEDVNLVKRFKLEAKAVSALNHPNIITIYEIVESKNLTFIVYEYINGKTLREKIIRNQLTISNSIKIVEQIAKGLAAAHKAGIIHRDIKPENIMIRDDGYVKILDFGLAKRSVFETDSQSKTSQLVETQEGLIMGSVQYMSPEQARGEKMDERTDIWSLGVVFYEMLTGKSPFAGKTLSDSIALVLQSRPPSPSQINQLVPQNLQKVIGNSLEKNRGDRYQNIESFLLELHGLNAPKETKTDDNQTLQYEQVANLKESDISQEKTLVQETQPVNNVETNKEFGKETRTTSNRSYWKWAAFAVIPVFLLITSFLALAGFGAWYYYSNTLAATIPFQKTQTDRLTKDEIARQPAISPDGKSIAYIRNQAGKQILAFRQIGNDGQVDLFTANADAVQNISFTSDGNFINFVLDDNGVGMIFQIPSIGGQPKILVQDVQSNVTYSPDMKRFAFVRQDISKKLSQIIISNIDGTEQKELINTKDSGFILFKDLAWSPDGKKLLMVALDGRPKETFRYVLGTIDLDSDSNKSVDKGFQVLEKDGCCLVSSVKWLKDGSGVVMLSRKIEDKTRQIYFVSYPDGVSHKLTNDANNYSLLDISADGKSIVAGTEKVTNSIWEFDLETKKATQLTPEYENLENNADMSVTDDGKVFYSKIQDQGISLFFLDTKTGKEQQFTLGGLTRGVTFSSDQKYIFTSANMDGKGQSSILRLDIDAKNPLRLTKTPMVYDFVPQTSPSGTLVFMRSNIDFSFPKLMKTSINGGDSEKLFDKESQLELFPKISPDGKYLAYNEFVKSDENPTSSTLKLKVVNFEDGKIGKTVLEKNISLYTRFAWFPDSKKLAFVDPDTKMNIKAISLNDKKEEVLTDFNLHSIYGSFAFSKDGKKIYVVRTAQIRDLVLIKDSR